MGAAETRALPFEFVKANYDAHRRQDTRRIDIWVRRVLPFVGGAFCDEKSAEEVRAFFEPKVDRFAGTRRNLAQALEEYSDLHGV